MKLENCLSHTTKNCPNPATKEGPACTPDKRNKGCPYYHPLITRTCEFVEAYDEKTTAQ